MSADNYLLVTRGEGSFEGGWPVYHLFASDEDTDLASVAPLLVGVSRDAALEWAHKWAMENVCEYGVKVASDVWGASNTGKEQELTDHLREIENEVDALWERMLEAAGGDEEVAAAQMKASADIALDPELQRKAQEWLARNAGRGQDE